MTENDLKALKNLANSLTVDLLKATRTADDHTASLFRESMLACQAINVLVNHVEEVQKLVKDEDLQTLLKRNTKIL